MSTPPLNQIHPVQVMLDHGNQFKVVLIIAPAGAGKHRLIQQWVQKLLEQSVPSPLWIYAANGTMNLLDFLTMLIHQLTSWDQYFGSLLEGQKPYLTDQPGYDPINPRTNREIYPRLENLLNQMLNRLMQFQEDRYIIILNYHKFRDPEIHLVIGYLIDFLPQNIHLIISSQEPPALQIPRLRARRELLEIGPEDLKYVSNYC